MAASENATKGEPMRDGLRICSVRAVEAWLQEQVAPAYDALKANPSHAVSAKHVRARLAAEHTKATAKR